jgi:hypothetical protein
MPKEEEIFSLLKTEYAGLFAGVGYEEVGIGETLQELPENSFIAKAKSNQLIAPLFEK